MKRYRVTYVIPNAPYHDGVGVGVFDTLLEAEQFKKEQAAKGYYDIKVEEASE